MAADILISFLVLLSILFFIPKLLVKTRIPAPVTEFFLGVVAALWLTSFVDRDLVAVFGTIGVVMIFFFAGIEAEIDFIHRNRRSIVVTILALLTVVLCAGLGAMALGFDLVTGLLIGIVLATPSAGFIISTVQHGPLDRLQQRYVIVNALSAEMAAIFLLIVLLGIEDIPRLFVTLLALAALVAFLPQITRFLFQHAFRHIVNVEFPLFFVIALVSAYFTEFLGLHFIIGAFIAGFIVKIFLESLVDSKSMTRERSSHVTEGMNFLAILFVPFYFFNVGLQFERAYFAPAIIVIAFAVFIATTAARLLFHGSFQALRSRNFRTELREAGFLLPTLMVGFVFADLLHQQGRITDTTFAVLIWYAVFTALTTILTLGRRKR